MKKKLYFSFLVSFSCITAQQPPKKIAHNKFDDVVKIGDFFKQHSNQYHAYNTVIHMDIDGVIIGKSKWLVPKLLWQMKTNPIGLIRALLKFKRGNDGSKAPFDTDGNPINGVTYQFLHCAKEDQKLLPYIVNLINTIQSYRVLSQGTETILKYLKDKDYMIFFATNKDHYGYLKATQTLGNSFSSIPDHVLCCEPGNTQKFMTSLKTFGQQNNIPQDVKKLFKQLHTLKENNGVHYAPWPKPRQEYWQKQRQVTSQYFKKDTNPHILFFDDKQENIEGINNYQDKKMNGYLFTTPKEFAQRLVTLGILDIEKDKELFDKL